jgi:spore coat protein CotH
MKMKIAPVLCFLLLVLLRVNALAADTIVVRSGQFGIDETKKLVIVNRNTEDINAEWLQEKEAIELDECYAIVPAVAVVETGMAYPIVSGQGDAYTLYFTQLPLIFITADETIVDEPKVPARFTMIEGDTHTVSSDMGIEIRGGFTQFMFSKKSYKLSFKEDATLEKSKDVSLLGLRSDDDWDLQAMANEPLRMNEKTSFDIWRKVNTLHYQSEEDEAINSCRMLYAELFLNGAYQGVYCVSEPVDRKQLKLKKYDDKKGIRGELYKGAGWGPTVFTSCPPYDNDSLWWVNSDGYGYEWLYPDEDEANRDWKGLHDFVYFVMNSSDADFNAHYSDYFEENNAIDYYLFINFARAEDNKGNNLFVAKYTKDEPYFYVPWDLDATFGNSWEGGKRDITDDIMSNGFYDRIALSPGGFKEKLAAKWTRLRKDWLTVDGLMNLFNENYDYLLRNGVYEREERTWKDQDKYQFDASYMDYLQDWIAKRLEFLDQSFGYTDAIPPVDASAMQYPCHVHIYNVSGQLVKAIHLTAGDKTPYTDLDAGVYILHFQSPLGRGAQKLMIY